MLTNKALITGAAGFCGQHLARLLLKHGYAVVGFDVRLSHVPGVENIIGDLHDADFVQQMLEATQPTHVFHLAAATSSTDRLEDFLNINVHGTQTLLKALYNNNQRPVILIAGSSAAYGRVAPNELPIVESQPFRPSTAYAVSKIAQELVGYQHYAAYGARVLSTRTFNLTGPGESMHFVTSAFARQIAEIEARKREPVLYVGNLNAVRDFTDVRDAMRAYLLLAEQGLPGEVYNVCSGKGTCVREILQLLLELSTRGDIQIQIDPLRLQTADVPIQIGSAEKLNALTGWTPTLTRRETLNDVLNSWRCRISEE